MTLHRVSLDEWNKLSESAHLAVFKERRPPWMNTFDYALFVEEASVPMTYATCIEFDSESVYMQHGGAFPPAEKSIKAYRGYQLIMEYLRKCYLRASTRIQNTNLKMLHMAMKEGFLINGVDLLENEVFVHLTNKLKEGD